MLFGFTSKNNNDIIGGKIPSLLTPSLFIDPGSLVDEDVRPRQERTDRNKRNTYLPIHPYTRLPTHLFAYLSLPLVVSQVVVIPPCQRFMD